MNLNFYSPHNAGSLEQLQHALQEQMEKLDQIRNIGLTSPKPSKVEQPLQPQRYYLDCGIKEDWEEFLKINYNLTEYQMFEDYKLFLQAKAELYEDTNKEKLQSMKEKIIGPKVNQQKPKQSNQQLNNQNMEPKVYASNNSNGDNSSDNSVHKPRMENNTHHNENKGGKHVR